MKLIKKDPFQKYLISQDCFSIVVFSLLLFLHSCATKKDTDFIDVESKQVESSLGIDEKKFNKFKVEDDADESQKEKVSAKKVSKSHPSNEKALIKKDDSKLRDKEASKKEKSKNKKVVNAPSKPTSKKSPEKESSLDSDKMEEGSLKEDESIDPYPEVFSQYDRISKKIWPKAKPIIDIGEKFVFQVSYLGITAGHIQMETRKPVKIGGEKAYHFSAKLRSARYYSYIYTLDDSLDSYVTQNEFIPMKYVLAQRESSQTVDDLQLFDREELKTYHWYKRIKHGKLKEVELTKHIPRYFQDSFSALHFVRSLPLKKGDLYEFPIVTRGKIWILKLKVERTETIEVMDEDVSAIRINAETRFPGVLEKRGDILFWFSADEKKKLLKFEAQVKIGSVAGELVEYKAGQPL